jgi:hypothetical protein
LRLEVPVFRRVTTHVHRPADLKPGEKRPAVLLIGEPGCKLAGALAARQRLVATHFSPAEHPLRPRASGKRDGQVVPRQAAST